LEGRRTACESNEGAEEERKKRERNAMGSNSLGKAVISTKEMERGLDNTQSHNANPWVVKSHDISSLRMQKRKS